MAKKKSPLDRVAELHRADLEGAKDLAVELDKSGDLTGDVAESLVRSMQDPDDQETLMDFMEEFEGDTEVLF